MKVLVTGGAGFIGSNIVRSLLEDGHEVVVLDNLHTGNRKNLAGLDLTVVEGSVSDILELRDRIGGVDGIFHQGVFSSSPMYRKDPFLVAEALKGMIALLEFARGAGAPVVFASTSSLYNGLEPPHREDMIPLVTDYYTEARYAMERIAELYWKLHGVRTVALRYFSIYGPHEEYKGKYANIVSQFLWDLAEGKAPVIFGDGSQTRDFVFVEDVVRANRLAMDRLRSGRIEFDVFNVGTGRNVSFNEVIRMLNAALGKDIQPEYVPNPIKNYVAHTKADTSKAERVLGFRAKVSLEEGIRKLIDYYGQKG